MRIVPCPRYGLDVTCCHHRASDVPGPALDKLRTVIGKLPFMSVKLNGVTHDGADSRRGNNVRVETVLVHGLFLFQRSPVSHIHRFPYRPFDIVVVGRQVEEILVDFLYEIV